ncbi:hypothetical protein DQ393_14205 [Rhizobium tropici]|uniref:Uncharacterized protein n=1 Tax=Rhizobium tropici TaxID=398 RepID=A0A329YFP4_RHITR|nr:hypothetical protein DQ393_14205 [Rhizobium tropici]
MRLDTDRPDKRPISDHLCRRDRDNFTTPVHGQSQSQFNERQIPQAIASHAIIIAPNIITAILIFP